MRSHRRFCRDQARNASASENRPGELGAGLGEMAGSRMTPFPVSDFRDEWLLSTELESRVREPSRQEDEGLPSSCDVSRSSR